MRFNFWISIAVSAALVACAGGQTGDPGVIDGTHVVKSGGARGAGLKRAIPATEAIGDSSTVSVGDTQMLALDGGLVALLDPRLGLRLLDTSDATAPRVLSRLSLRGSRALDLQRLSGKRLLVVQRYPQYAGERDALNEAYGRTVSVFGRAGLAATDVVNGANSVVTLVDIADPSAPRELDALPVAGAVLATAVIEGDGRTLLFAVTDAPPNTDAQIKATQIVSIEASATALVQRAELNLAAESESYVTALRFVGQRLIAARENGRASLVLLGDDGSLHEGKLVDSPRYPRARGLGLVDGVLRIGGMARDEFGTAGTMIINVYDASDPDNMSAAGSCVLGAVNDAVMGATLDFVGARALWQPRSPSAREAHLVAAAETGACSTSSLTLDAPASWYPVLGGTRAVSVQLDGNALNIALVATDPSSSFEALARSRVAAPGFGDFRPDQSLVLQNMAAPAHAADGTEESGWLLVPFIASDEHHAAQLFSFSDHTLTPRAVLPGLAAVALPSGTLAALSQTELSVFDPAAGERLGVLAVNAFYADAIDFDDFIARRRVAPPRLYRVDDAPTGRDLVELVPNADDPQRGAAVGSVEVDVRAQLFGSGHTLLALTMDRQQLELHAELFDVSDPSTPKRLADFDAPVPGLEQCRVCSANRGWRCNCYDAKFEALPFEHGLILQRRGQSEIELEATPSVAGFTVIDLRDPEQPSAQEIVGESEEIIDAAFVHESSLYYSYYIPQGIHREDAGVGIDGGVQYSPIEVDRIDAGAEDPYQRAFFAVRRGYRQIDLSDASQPKRHPRVEVPGRLQAIDAKGALYVSDDTFDAGRRNVFLRKLETRAGNANVRANVALGDVSVAAMVASNDGQLVVQVMGPNWNPALWVEDGYPLWRPGTSLLGFDANLKRKGAIEVDPYCELRALRDGRAILQGVLAGQGVYVVDLHDLAAPKLQAYYALDTTDEGSVLLQSGRLVIEAAQGLRVIDPAASHL